MQYSPYSSLGQASNNLPDARITSFAVQRLKRCGAIWEHDDLFYYADYQRWGFLADGSRPWYCNSFCHGPCLYIETPGQPDMLFHSGETYKYKIVILRCLACEATNSVCDGQTPCKVCIRDAVECFPYSELVDGNLVWSRWTSMPYDAIDTSNFVQNAEEGEMEGPQPNSLDRQGQGGAFSSVACQPCTSPENELFFAYQQQPDMPDLVDPYFQPTPTTSFAAYQLDDGPFSSPEYSQRAHLISETTDFQQHAGRHLHKTSTASRKRHRTDASIKGKGVELSKRPRTDSAVMPQTSILTAPFTPGARDTTREDQQNMGESSEQTQNQFQMPMPEWFRNRPKLLLESSQQAFCIDDAQQNSIAPFEAEEMGPDNAKLSQVVNLSPPAVKAFPHRSFSLVEQLPATNSSPTKTTSRSRSKPPPATVAINYTTTNPISITAAGPGTRTGGGRYDGATYDAPPPSTSLPLHNCNLTAVEILTYLPKHAWSHPDICMRLVDEGWGDSTMADYISLTRGRRQLKNSIGKSITSIGKAKYPYFRVVSEEQLARLPHDYGTAPIPGLDDSPLATGGKTNATEKRHPKITSQWRVKLHRKINHLPQVSLATDGFAPGRISLPMWQLAEGVRPDRHPTGPDALDLTRCVRYAVQTRVSHEWIFPDDWNLVLAIVGGPALVTAEHFDRPALERWKAVREGLSDRELCKEKVEEKGGKD